MLVSVVAPEVRFSSVGEMKQDIETGNFTEAELKQIGRFNYAESTKSNRIATVSTSKLKDAEFPSMFSLEYVTWNGSRYVFSLIDSAGGTAIIQEINKADYDERMQQVYSDSARDDRLISRQTNSPYRNATIDEFKGAFTRMKAAVYTIEDGDRILYVIEHYDSATLGYCSIPRSIEVLITQGSQYTWVYISSPKENPSIEDLKTFDLKDYVEAASS